MIANGIEWRSFSALVHLQGQTMPTYVITGLITPELLLSETPGDGFVMATVTHHSENPKMPFRLSRERHLANAYGTALMSKNDLPPDLFGDGFSWKGDLMVCYDSDPASGGAGVGPRKSLFPVWGESNFNGAENEFDGGTN